MVNERRVVERKVEVLTYKVRAMCELCPAGEFLPTGIASMAIPPLYEHKCNECGELRNIRGKQYPEIRYEEKK